MSPKSCCSLLLALLLLFAGTNCEMIVLAVSHSSRDWASLQSVGGLALGTPVRDDSGRVALPIRCDVSGTQTITVRPIGIDSGSVCERPIVRVRSNTIYLTVRTMLAGREGLGGLCPPADLGKLATGTYAVIYLDPQGSHHPLGTIQIPD